VICTSDPIAWIYVVLMMAVAEATSTQGTVLGAVFTFLLYGLLPLSIVLYMLGTPTGRTGVPADASEAAEAASTVAQTMAAAMRPVTPLAAEREEP
jgi:mannose/fructose/N-acetylgalactosamine-specific phosphotransferase system component IID